MARKMPLPAAIEAACEPFESIAEADLDPLLARIGDSRIVLLGEATHGTSEFYRMRAAISRALIERKGFSIVAIEGDWPDAARIDRYVRHLETPASEWTAFSRFPVWMWRNREVLEFVDWMRERNGSLDAKARTAFYGLDLYSLYNSMRQVLDYLDDTDPEVARIARARYGCLMPWQSDPATYGHAALTGAYESCERHVIAMLTDLLQKQSAHAGEPGQDGERFLDAVQNAKLVANAEKYYRTMYYGSRESWNLRDSHMFDTLQSLLEFHGPQSKALVWAHNSHVGDARATEMSLRGEHNIGQLCRQRFDGQTYIVGFGTDTGTVAAATHWDEPMEVKNVRAAVSNSYERACHDSGVARFLLPLREAVMPTDAGADGVKVGGVDSGVGVGGVGSGSGIRETAQQRRTNVINRLSDPRLERAIGVIYRPDTELQSHYFQAVLPRQFDEYVWFDRSEAVTVLATHEVEGQPDTYPFGV